MKYFDIKNKNIENELVEFINHTDMTESGAEETVLKIKKNILNKGFDALAEYSEKFDRYKLTKQNIRVTKEEIDELASKINRGLSSALETAVNRITDFHKKQIQEDFTLTDSLGNRMGQKVMPIESVAVYVPGGRALYPSTIYMTVIPAMTAGVKRIVLLSPPNTFQNSPEVARLVQLLGIDEIYRIGGAQAIISAAYGLPELPAVDKIVGPGNIFVAKAQQMVFGKVDIDMIAGPSEILVIADTDKEEDIPSIAMDLLSQAEHDPMARSILVGLDEKYLLKIKEKTYELAITLATKENALKSLNDRGLIIKCPDIDSAVMISNKIAPEHLEIFSESPYPIFDKIKNAGSVFLGRYTPESVGDYLGGPNHVLPTSGTARFSSPLGVYDFQKRLSYIEFSRNSLEKLKNDISTIARSEKLEAHARSAEIRFENER